MQRFILFGTEKRERESIRKGEKEIEGLLSRIIIQLVLDFFHAEPTIWQPFPN
jgi:hypothetical protein